MLSLGLCVPTSPGNSGTAHTAQGHGGETAESAKCPHQSEG